MSDYESIQADVIADIRFEAQGGRQVLWDLTVNGVHYSCEFADEEQDSFVYTNFGLATKIAYLIDTSERIVNPFDMEEEEFYNLRGWKLATETDGYIFIEDIESVEWQFEPVGSVFG